MSYLKRTASSFSLDGTAVTRTAAQINAGIVSEEVVFTEDGDTTYTGSVSVPAGATITNIAIFGQSLWDDGTSASMIVGDAVDDNGWFVATNLKATDLLAGEVIDFNNTGGKEGAFIVTASGLRSEHYSAAATTVVGVVTTGAQNGTAGVTRMLVQYTVPVTSAATGV